MEQPFIIGSIQAPVGNVPKISSSLAWTDIWGSIKARWGVGRMSYTVDPGLYALGNPNDESPVLVTANYKMSFDRLREALQAHSAWIMVLNTEGINVWCAAGKGTFGTDNLIQSIEICELTRVASHRELILPQLAAPGIAAHLIKKLSGFKVIYGPIHSKDLSAFLDSGLKATPAMRLMTFSIWDRTVLIPIELVGALKPSLIIMAIFFLLGGLGGTGGFWANALNHGLFAVYSLLAALFAGAVLTPLLLPWLPGRAFSLKGITMGIVMAMILFVVRFGDIITLQSRLEITAWFFIVPAVAAYLAMNFTGASTYTSLSGVKKEMKWAVPMEAGGVLVGLAFWLGSRFVA
jgi:acetyl-CoA decarbonylase/synthase complex subunit gamma